jgi:tRNA-specific 2-thiouridylase
MMRPHQVRIAQFPIGHLLKPELRDLAREFWLKTAEKKDSQGICFIGQVKMEDFLRTFVPDKPGPIVESRRQGAGRASRPASLHARPAKGHRRRQSAAQAGLRRRRQTSADNELVVAIEIADTPLLWARNCRAAVDFERPGSRLIWSAPECAAALPLPGWASQIFTPAR